MPSRLRFIALGPLVVSIVLSVLIPSPLAAQQTMSMPMPMAGPAPTLFDNILRHTASGTSLEPGSISPPMLMKMTEPGKAGSGKLGEGWMLMLHGQAALVEQQQTGPRAHDKLFSTNWIMPMAQRNVASGQLTLRAMLSLEPATISGRYYPELFQQGETAFGRPILDGQHPHNLFMELAVLYDLKLGERALLSFYAAPVGDPSLGPVAFPHRASASDNPLAPLGHHLEDSTHIADDVVTAGLSVSKFRIEASGFHGREPDENRWHIEVGGIDSWSARLTAAPAKDLTLQYSLGHLHSPEAAHPAEDVLRQTASISFHHAWSITTLDVLTLWGRNHTIASAENANAYLFEATAHLHASHSLWTRIENADRTTDLFGVNAPPVEAVAGRVQAYSAGYAHRLYSNGWSTYELGAQATFYNTPPRLRSEYGDHPQGIATVLKIYLGR